MAFVFQDLGVCISNHPQTSLLKMYANQLACIKRQLFDCLLRSNNPTSEIERHSRAVSFISQLTPRYCGAFSWDEFKIFSSHMKYFIKIVKGHLFYHEVLTSWVPGLLCSHVPRHIRPTHGVLGEQSSMWIIFSHSWWAHTWLQTDLCWG